jgi:hypothetical protein
MARRDADHNRDFFRAGQRILTYVRLETMKIAWLDLLGAGLERFG